MQRSKVKEIMRRAAVLGTALLFVLFCAVGCKIDLGLPEAPKQEETAPELALDGIELFVTSAEIGIGGQFLLSSVPVTEDMVWASFDESVASVENGLVTALAVGETTVTASDGGDMESCAVTVKPYVQGVKVTSTDANLTVGDKISFSSGLPARYHAVWSSSDESVASVNEGVVFALSVGEAEIFAQYETFSASFTLTVMEERQDVTEEPTPGGSENPVVPGDPNNPNRPHIPSTPSTPSTPTRQLIWSDEFDADTLDESKWEYQLGVQDTYVNQGQTSHGPWFWGNNELQYYTKDAVSLAEGVMTITAERKSGLAYDRQFTSARITTRDRGYWTYGYFEARMKLPAGTGMWPAFWLLPQPEAGMGTNNRYGGWAANGEVDIMEAKGRLLNEVGNTLHFGGNPSSYVPHTVRLSEPITEWHTYGLEWRRDHIAWFVDGTETFRLKNTSWYSNSELGANSQTAPFDVPFYIIINLAVGGNYDGGRAPDASLTSAAMEVDYVRVYA